MKLGRLLAAFVQSNDRRFISLLCQQADLAVKSLQLLQDLEGEELAPRQRAEAVKQVEREGDEVRRVLIDELMGTFSTPFDREDVFALSRTIDDIIDAADEAARELFTFKIPPPEELKEMTGVLLDGARHIRLAVGELLDHPLVAAEHAVRAKRSENRIDDLYHAALDALFDNSTVTSELLKAREIYRHLKNSADRIDETADEISVIVIKRS
jgi:predicted phosphate transport protein (TIGR00153 family)